MDTSLDRRKILLLGRPKADDAVSKFWIRNRKRGDDDRNGSVFLPARPPQRRRYRPFDTVARAQSVVIATL
jgi:hypothetical protein